MLNEPTFVAALFIAALAGFYALIALLGRVLSRSSGYVRLLERYPDREEEPVLIIAGASVRMGSVTVRGGAEFHACPSGLRIQLSRLLPGFRRRVFIGWRDIASTETQLQGSAMTRLALGKPPISDMTVDSALWRELEQARH